MRRVTSLPTGGIRRIDARDVTRAGPGGRRGGSTEIGVPGWFRGVGADLELGGVYTFWYSRLVFTVSQYRTALLAIRSIDPMVDYLPSTGKTRSGDKCTSLVF